ncbi:MAG: hypothetical protein L3J06_01390 [Cyclobacteriaceae bacterium]|nr:hypothetical protein [Cyclobacteriaceae bacterium]
MKPLKNLILFTAVVLISCQAYGQGCSDAGFCTMGAMKPDQAYNKKVKLKLRSIELSYYQGQTTLTPVVTVINLDAGFSITKNLSGQIRLPYYSVKGNFANTSAIGDISLSLTQRLIDTENFDLSATIGTKIPTNNSAIKSSGKRVPGTEGLVLPMYYQTSLGSVDFVAGASLISSKWLIATGVQMALTANNNTWFADEWVGIYPSEEYVRLYDDANLLKRGTDIMLRVERNFRFSKYSFNVGLLPIFRITKDQIVDRDTQEYVKLEGSTGMALTALAGAAYNFNINNTVKFTYGQKITVRDVNPDGLTRNNVLIVAYLFRF